MDSAGVYRRTRDGVGYALIPRTPVNPQELRREKPLRKSRKTLALVLQFFMSQFCLGPRKRRVLPKHCDPLSSHLTSHNKNLVHWPQFHHLSFTSRSRDICLSYTEFGLADLVSTLV
jgi:hypothetical protein